MASDKADKEKAKRVEQLSDSIDDLRDQVKDDLDSDDMRTKLTALAISVMDETYARPGNRRSVKERSHYGITQLECRHFSFRKNKVTIEYTGKKGVDQKKQFENAKLKKLLKERCDEVGKNSCIFCFKDGNGNHRRVDAGDVNSYLRDFDITAKDIRGFHANNLMKEKVKEIRKNNGSLPDDEDDREKQLKEEFKEALDEVSEMLGHKASTLKGSYLVPHFEDEWLQDAEPPKKFSKASFIANKVANRVAREQGILPLTRSANTGQILPPPPWEMTKSEFTNWTPPKPDPGHELVFHGTTRENARKIARNGLKVSKATSDLGGEIWATRARGVETPAELNTNYGAYIWIQADTEDRRVVPRNRSELVFRRDVGLEDILLVDLAYDVPNRMGRHLLSSARTNRWAESAWEQYQKTASRGPNRVFEASNIQNKLMQEYEGLNLWVREIDDSLVVLSKITLPEEKRGSGLGSKIMNKLTRWADRKSVTIATTPSGDFGGDANRLDSFYRKFGFVKNSGADKVWETSETMIRPPNSSKTGFSKGRSAYAP